MIANRIILSKLLERFDRLIAEADEILASANKIPAQYGHNRMTGEPFERAAAYTEIDWPRFVEWRTKAATLLGLVLPKEHVHRSAVESMPALQNSESKLEWGISVLKGIKNDLEEGFLDDLFSRIEAQIAADYMGQAQHLLSEGSSGKFDHVPAAVLTGAVLEKALRTVCERQEPPVPTVTASGELKTLNPLIDDLKKAGVFNELKAKQLRSWADIRNRAAHGEFDEFKRSDVEQMIQGITNFLADYLA
jgi:hypothetical protein